MCDSMLYPEETICVIFLHDTVEDYDVTEQQLTELFGERVAKATMRMSKVIRGVKTPNDIYYKDMTECPIASSAKGCDRVHNLMTMVGGFKPEKQSSYIDETMDFVVPMLKEARRIFPKQEPLYENIKFVMTNQITLYREMLSINNRATTEA